MGAVAASAQGIHTDSSTDLVNRIGSKKGMVALSTYSNTNGFECNLTATMKDDGTTWVEVRRNGTIIHSWQSPPVGPVKRNLAW